MLSFFDLNRYCWASVMVILFSPVSSIALDEKIEKDVVAARTFFSRHEYHKTLLALPQPQKSYEALWLRAESYFRLENFSAAEAIYKQIAKATNDGDEREKAALRIFESRLFAGDINGAQNRFAKFARDFKKDPPSRMAYGLGKALYDQKQISRAYEILGTIAKTSEYSMRARYIMGSVDVDKRNLDQALKTFVELQTWLPISTEDYWVRDLSILAEARLHADAGRIVDAEKAYLRVPLTSGFSEIATSELVNALLYQRELSEKALGPYAKKDVVERQRVSQTYLQSALDAIFRFRKTHEVSAKTPELLSVLASLLVESRRYDDARIAYDALILHFRPLREMLRRPVENNELWPIFAVDYQSVKNIDVPVIKGVPNLMVRDLPLLKSLLLRKERIEESGKRLSLILEDLRIRGVTVDKQLNQARARQIALERAYQKVVLQKQPQLRAQIAEKLSAFLADAEYRRADLVIAQMRDLEKKNSVVQNFTRSNLDTLLEKQRELDVSTAP